MSRFLRALLVSATATAAAFIVSEVVRPTSRPNASAARSDAPPKRSSAPEDELSAEMKNALVTELGQHV